MAPSYYTFAVTPGISFDPRGHMRPFVAKAGIAMSHLADLLRIDAFARAHGCGLNPKLRETIEADLRWHSQAASPDVPVPDRLPDTVISLAEQRDIKALGPS